MRAGIFRAIAGAICALGLTGCGGGGLTLGGLGSLNMPPETVTVAGRSVVVGGPTGYCVDRAASRLAGDTPFVLLGSCASIADDVNAPTPEQPGVLTAAVSAQGGGPSLAETLPQLEQFVRSAEGRAGLARDGQAGSVNVLSTRREGDAMFIHVRDTSTNLVPGLGSTYWRGLFEVKGRLVTVSVMEFEDQPIGSDASLSKLRGFISRIQRESAAI